MAQRRRGPGPKVWRLHDTNKADLIWRRNYLTGMERRRRRRRRRQWRGETRARAGQLRRVGARRRPAARLSCLIFVLTVWRQRWWRAFVDYKVNYAPQRGERAGGPYAKLVCLLARACCWAARGPRSRRPATSAHQSGRARARSTYQRAV